MKEIDKLRLLRQPAATPEFVQGRYEHCRDRMGERWGQELSFDEWEELNLAVFKEKGAEWIDRGDSAGSGLYRVWWRGIGVLVYFSETAYLVLTVLPRTDPRLQHIRNGTYEHQTCSDADLVLRDQRRELAAQLEGMELNDKGFLAYAPLVDNSAERVLADEPSPGNQMAEALSGLLPMITAPLPRTTLTTVPAEPATPVMDASVAALFAQLERQFDEQDGAIGDEQQAMEQRIADLEAQIASLRAESPALLLKRQFLDMGRNIAKEAMDKHVGGILNVEAVLSVGRMILAQQAAPMEPKPEPAKPSYTPRQLQGISIDGPPPEIFKRGVSTIYRLDGVEANQSEWAKRAGITMQTIPNRMAKGWTFREALFGERVKDASSRAA